MKLIKRSHYFLLIALIVACSRTEPEVQIRQIVSFGTTVEVTLANISQAEADIALTAIEQELHFMHDQWHAWRPSSITRLNEQLQSGKPFELDRDLIPLIEQSKQLYLSSMTYFNPAIGKLIQLWGFYQDNPQLNQSLPDDSEIQELVISNPNMNDIQLNDGFAIGMNPNLQVDFGGYAKGYGVEQLIKQLKLHGIHDAMINAGGDIKVIGKKQDRHWKVAIEDPYNKTPLGWLYLDSGESIFSSGDYRRFFTIEGKRYHHIIDPETGYPSQHARGATVIVEDGAIADAAATALMVAPQHDWMKLKENMGLKHILVVANDGTLYCDAELATRLNLLSDKSIRILEPQTTN